ncbi:MAG: hypothetical protein AAB502_10440, partial [Chloroflexota bacterium]
MNEYDEILKGFRHFAKAREIFAKYKGKWFSGNDNHVGDIGEYWAIRHFLDKKPKLAPNRISPFDFELQNGTRFSVKTMSTWNQRGRSTPIKGINV